MLILKLFLRIDQFTKHQRNHESKLALLFLNRTFENWHRQQQNKIKKNNNKNGLHLLPSCNDKLCKCVISQDLVLRAFDIAVGNFALFTTLNRIYKFNENYDLLAEKIQRFITIDNAHPNHSFDKVKLINELDLYERYMIDFKEVAFLNNSLK